MPRSYRLGRRQAAVDSTRVAILTAARDELASGEPGLSAGAVARRAGVSRLTVYNQFGSKAGLLRELAEQARKEGFLQTGSGARRSGRPAPAADCRLMRHLVLRSWLVPAIAWRRERRGRDGKSRSISRRATRGFGPPSPRLLAQRGRGRDRRDHLLQGLRQIVQRRPALTDRGCRNTRAVGGSRRGVEC